MVWILNRHAGHQRARAAIRRGALLPTVLLTAALLLATEACLVRVSAQDADPDGPTLPNRWVATIPYTPLEIDTPAAGQPFSYTHVALGQQTVRVRLEDKMDATFYLDTGSSTSYVATDVVAELHLTPQPSFQGRTFTFNGEHKDVVNLGVSLGPAPFLVPSVIIPRALLNPPIQGATKVDGILGSNMLGTCAQLLDFQRHTLTIILAGKLTPAEVAALGFGDAQAFSLTPSDQAPTAGVPGGLYLVQAQLSNGSRSLPLPLMLDTGSDGSIVSAAAAQALGLTSIGPEHEGYLYALGSYHANSAFVTLKLGSVTLRDESVTYPLDSKTQVWPTLGVDVLSKFRVLLDIPALKMYLLPVQPLGPQMLSVQIKPSGAPSPPTGVKSPDAAVAVPVPAATP